ncbi:MAG: hypothetical protein MZV65_35500 [Chromatiales bacterium]|nr:hypothetical protein [Chromatiales bacterium]
MKARARLSVSSLVCAPRTISTSCICATGLKKCRPTSRDGSLSDPAMSSSGMLEVLVASSALAGARCSMLANRSRLASTFSTIASMTRSARARPSPLRSGISRSIASCTARGCLSFFL